MSGGTRTIGQLPPTSFLTPDSVLELEVNGASRRIAFSDLRDAILSGFTAYDLDPAVGENFNQINEQIANIQSAIDDAVSAAQAATQADAARLAAISARGNAETVAQFVQGVSEGVQSDAQAANTAKLAAQTASGSASASATAASGSAVQALTSAAQAGQYVTLTVQYRDQASGYATSASASALSASASATSATNSANLVASYANGSNARISALETAVSDGRFAAASSVTSLTAQYSTLAASVSTNSTVIANLQAQSASFEQRISAGNNANRLKNGTGALGKLGWTDRAGAWGATTDSQWGPYFYWGYVAGTIGYLFMDSDAVGCIPSLTYTAALEADAWASGGPAYAQIQLLWYAGANGTGALVRQDYGNLFPSPSFGNPTACRQGTKLTATAPSNASSVVVRVVVASSNAFGGAAFRRIKLEEGSIATGWSDDASVAVQYQALTSTNSQLASLSSTVATQGASISQNASALSNLNGSFAALSTTVSARTAAFWEVTAVSGEGRAQVRVRADANGGGGVDITGDLRVNGNAVIAGTLTASSIEANGITDFVQAYNGTTYNGANYTYDPITFNYIMDYWDIINFNVYMKYPGDIMLFAAMKQDYHATNNAPLWRALIDIDGTQVFNTNGGAGFVSDSVVLLGKLSVGQGYHTVRLRWLAGNSTLYINAGAAALIAFRRYA